MMRITVFTTLKELESLTGLTTSELWDAGFNLDDWDIGFKCPAPLHDVSVPADDDGDLSEDYGNPYHWLFARMQNYCVGPSFVKHKRSYYYLVHHS